MNAHVGYMSASDPDANQVFTYSLSNNPGGLFKLAGTGNNELKTFAAIAFAAYPTVTIGVTVMDQGGLTYTQNLLIVVQYVPSPPGVSSTSMSVDENSLVGALVGHINNNSPGMQLTFTPLVAGSDPAALTLFQVQNCSGYIFVNQVRCW